MSPGLASLAIPCLKSKSKWSSRNPTEQTLAPREIRRPEGSHEFGDGRSLAVPLAAVLLEALGARVDGVLTVDHGGAKSRLYFRDGRPVAAQVVQVAAGFRPLGTILLQAGKIDVDALSRSLATMAETGRLQGEILVEMGAVARTDVEAALAEQQAGYFGIIAALDSGRWSFEHSAKLPDWTHDSHLLPGSSLVDAFRRPQAAGLVEAALRPVTMSDVQLSPAHTRS